MGKRSAVVELFLGDMGSMQRELRPSTQREDQLTMETKLEQIAVKAANQLPKSVVREIRTPRSVGTGGGRPPPVTRWARRNPRPYRDHRGVTSSCSKRRPVKKADCASIASLPTYRFMNRYNLLVFVVIEHRLQIRRVSSAGCDLDLLAGSCPVAPTAVCPHIGSSSAIT